MLQVDAHVFSNQPIGDPSVRNAWQKLRLVATVTFQKPVQAWLSQACQLVSIKEDLFAHIK